MKEKGYILKKFFYIYGIKKEKLKKFMKDMFGYIIYLWCS